MMAIKAWPGVRLEATSAPRAFALTDSINVLMTGSATSASSRATRTSRMDSPILSSVMRPRPRRFSMVRDSRAVRLSNMGFPAREEQRAILVRQDLSGSRNAVLNDAPSIALLCALLFLLVIIAFSSGTEVAMLSVNRYRIKHRAQQGQKTAKVLEGLLQKPDDWLGANLVILAAASVFASSIATILAQRTGYYYAIPITG